MSFNAATSTPVITTAQTRALSLRWIIGARDDLVWFIGAALPSYLFFALYISNALPVLPILGAWLLLVDTPHVFATFTRTYFDREERRARRPLLYGSLLFFLLGPVMVLAGAGAAFFFFAIVWAFYHQIKQHYGFMVLYKIRNHDLADIDNALDRLFLLFSFVYPFAVFILRSPKMLARVPAPLAARLDYLYAALLALTATIACAWLLRQIQRAVQRQSINLPKYLLFAAVIPLYWLVLLADAPYHLSIVVLILSPFHTLQYHRLIWRHNRKYTRDAEARSRYGAITTLINRHLLGYLAAAIVFSLGYHLLRRHVIATRGLQDTFTHLVLAFLLGHLLVHFYLDSKIWRVRRDPHVGKSLNMN